MTRHAISPRLAIKIFWNIVPPLQAGSVLSGTRGRVYADGRRGG
jgi:hypothetical protein